MRNSSVGERWGGEKEAEGTAGGSFRGRLRRAPQVRRTPSIPGRAGAGVWGGGGVKAGSRPG